MEIIRKRTYSTLVVIATFAWTSAAAQERQIEISFPVVETQGAEEKELEKKRKRPSSYWCDPVEFDVNAVFKLTEQVKFGEVDVQSSIVVVQIRGKGPLTYKGEYSWVEKDGKAAEWRGRLEGAEDFGAWMVLNPKLGTAEAVFDSEHGSYRLYTSAFKRIFYLCEFDPNRLPHKID